MVLIDPSNGKVQQATVFDTYESSEELNKFISDIPKGCIVVAACMDDC